MTNTQPRGLSSESRNALRAFLRRVRNGTTPGFENRRIGSGNEADYSFTTGSVVVRETWDGVLEFTLSLEDAPASVPNDISEAPSPLPTVARTIIIALNDTFSGMTTVDDFTTTDSEMYVLRYSITGRRPI